MNWPAPQDYNEAIQEPGLVFTDPELKAGQTVVGSTGLPLPRSGNFADVYQVKGKDGRDWAVKCFTRPTVGMDQRYQKIGDHLAQANLPFTVGFSFHSQGIQVKGEWYPVLKMEWVEGLLINQIVRDNAGKPGVLEALFQMWPKLCKRLREAGVAHADLQHGNVLLVPGAKPGTFGLKLIDYDGMYTPALANQPAGELGHANFQHPARASSRIYSQDLDRFPHLVIATALKGLAVLGPSLWERYDSGENLLFAEADFQAPAESALLRELWSSSNLELKALAGRLALACKKPIPQTPWLDAVVVEGLVKPLTPVEAGDAAALLQPAGAPAPAPPPARPAGTRVAGAPGTRPVMGTRVATPSAFDNLDAEEESSAPFEIPTARRRKKKSSPLPYIIGAGALALVAGVGLFFALAGGKKKKEVAQDTTTHTEEIRGSKPSKKDGPTTATGEGTKPPAATALAEDADPPGEEGQVKLAELPGLPERWNASLDAKGAIGGMAFSKDGSRIAAFQPTYNSVAVFDAKTGTKTGEFTRHTHPVVGLAALSDGKFVSLAVGEEWALVWDPSTLKAERLSIQKPVTSAANLLFLVSPDARYVATATIGQPAPGTGILEATNLSVWDSTTNKPAASLDFTRGAARFSVDSKRLFLAEEKGRFRTVTFAQTGAQTTDVAAEKWTVNRILGLSPDGARAVCYAHKDRGGKNEMAVYDTAAGAWVQGLGGPTSSPGIGLDFSPDGKWLYTVQRDSTKKDNLVLFDTASWKAVAYGPINRVSGTSMTVSPRAAYFAPDGKSLVATRIQTGATSLRSFELPREGITLLPPEKVVATTTAPTPTPTPTPKVDPPPTIPAPSPGPINPTLSALVTPSEGPNGPDRPLWAVDLNGTQSVRLSYSLDGSCLYVGLRGSVVALDARTGKVLATYEPTGTGPGRQDLLNVQPLLRGSVFINSDASTSHLTIWDPKTGKSSELKAPEIPGAPSRMYYMMSPDERFLVAARRPISQPDPKNPPRALWVPAPFRLFDLTTGQTVLANDWKGGSVRFSFDSSLLLVSVRGDAMKWYKLPSGRDELQLFAPPTENHIAEIHGLSATGKKATILYRGTPPGLDTGLYILNGKGESLRRIGSGIYGELSQDGKVLVSYRSIHKENGWMDDFEMQEVETGRLLAHYSFDRSNAIRGETALSPDGSSLAVYYGMKGIALYSPSRKGSGVVSAPTPRDPITPTPTPAPPSPPAVVGTGKPRWTVAGIEGKSGVPVFSRDGRTIYINCNGANILPYDVSSGKPGRPFTMGALSPTSHVTVQPLAPAKLAMLTISPTIYDPKTSSVTPLALPALPRGEGRSLANRFIRFSNDGKYVAWARTSTSTADPADPKKRTYHPAPLRVFELATGKAVLSLDWISGTAQFTPDGSRILIAEKTGVPRWFKIPSGEPDGTPRLAVEPESNIRIQGLSSDGSRILIFSFPKGGGRNALAVVDTKAGTIVRKIDGPIQASMSDDGLYVAYAFFGPNVDGVPSDAVEVVEVSTGKNLLRASVPKAQGEAPATVVLSSDARSLAVYRTSGTLTMFDVLGGSGPSPGTVATIPTPAPSVPAAGRLPVPAEAAATKAAETVRSILSKEYALKTPAQRKALAEKLLKLAEETTDDAAARYVMFRDARDFAVEAGDAGLALHAVKEITRLYDLDPMAQRLQTLEKLQAASSASTALKGIAEQALEAADEAWDAGDFETALKLTQLASASSKKGNYSAGVDDAEFHLALIKKSAEAHAALKKHLETLKGNPADPAANLAVGKFYCFIEGRWDEGINHLMLGYDPVLKQLATNESQVAQGAVDVKVADGWWDYAQSALAGEKKPAEFRARYWYQRSAAGLSGLAKVRAEARGGFSLAGADYRPGLVLDYKNTPAAVLKGKKSQIEATVDFTGAEFKELKSSLLTVRWTGTILPPQGGVYRLVVGKADPVRIRVNQHTVIDTISSKTAAATATVRLPDQAVPFSVEYATNTANPKPLQLRWVPAGTLHAVPVPAEAFYHDKKAEAALGK